MYNNIALFNHVVKVKFKDKEIEFYQSKKMCV